MKREGEKEGEREKAGVRKRKSRKESSPF